jgi:transcriptional regulator with XRE-family HTH domain
MRKAEHLTQQELADELALSRLTIVKLENGENPTIETLLKVLQYFDEMKSINQFVSDKIENLDINQCINYGKRIKSLQTVCKKENILNR